MKEDASKALGEDIKTETVALAKRIGELLPRAWGCELDSLESGESEMSYIFAKTLAVIQAGPRFPPELRAEARAISKDLFSLALRVALATE